MIKRLQLEESQTRQDQEETRKATFGSKQGLQVIMDRHSNLDSVGTIFGNDNSFKVYIGQPTSFPMLTSDRLTLSTGKSTESMILLESAVMLSQVVNIWFAFQQQVWGATTP